MLQERASSSVRDTPSEDDALSCHVRHQGRIKNWARVEAPRNIPAFMAATANPPLGSAFTALANVPLFVACLRQREMCLRRVIHPSGSPRTSVQGREKSAGGCGIFVLYRRAGGNLRLWSGGDTQVPNERVSRSQQTPSVWFAVFGPGIPRLKPWGAVNIS